MNIVQALNKVKFDILNFVTENLQLKADADHTHEDILNFVTENLQLKADADHTHEVLGSHQYGDELPEAGIVGRIFFKKVNN